MKQPLTHFVVFIALVLTLPLLGFECGSPEMEGAKLALQQKNFLRAEELLKKEVKNNPKNEDAWFTLGKLYAEQNRYAEMKSAFSSATMAGKVHSEEIRIAQFNMWARLLNEGASHLNNASNATGDSAVIYRREAISHFNDALLFNADSVVTYRNLAIAYFALNEPGNAIQTLQKALSIEKNYDVAYEIVREYYNKAVVLRDAGKADDARVEFIRTRDFIKEIQLWTVQKNVQLQSVVDDLLLTTYLELGDTVVAMASYNSAVQKDPGNKIYRLNYGILLMRAGKTQDAAQQFDMALQTDPEWEDGLLAAGEAYLKIGMKQQEDARRIFNESKKKDAVLDTTFKTTVRKSVQYLQSYTAKNPNNPGAWTNLGTGFVLVDGNDKRGKPAYEKEDALYKK